MSDHDYLDFLSAVGESFCEALHGEPEYDEASPQDYQEVLWNSLGDPLSPELISEALNGRGLERVLIEFQNWFEVDSIPRQKIIVALQNCLVRWPVGSLKVLH